MMVSNLARAVGAALVGDGDGDAAQRAGEPERRLVVVADGRPELVPAAQSRAGAVEARRRDPRDLGLADWLAVAEQRADAGRVAGLGEPERELVCTRRDHRVGRDHVARFPVQIVHVAKPAVLHVEREPTEDVAEREQHAVDRNALRELDVGGDRMRSVLDVHRDALGHRRAERQ